MSLTTIQRVFSGTYREPIAGYCRVLKRGNHIFISGTTASDGDKLIGIGDPEAQMRFIMKKIEKALNQVDATLEDVVRTRIYIKNQKDCETIVRVHGEYFKDREPTNTCIQAILIGEEFLVEVECDAIVDKEYI